MTDEGLIGKWKKEAVQHADCLDVDIEMVESDLRKTIDECGKFGMHSEDLAKIGIYAGHGTIEFIDIKELKQKIFGASSSKSEEEVKLRETKAFRSSDDAKPPLDKKRNGGE